MLSQQTMPEADGDMSLVSADTWSIILSPERHAAAANALNLTNIVRALPCFH